MKYQELKEGIEHRLNSAAEDFFTIGYYLRQISEGALFVEDGYKSIWEFAKGEFNLSTASASRFMAINSKFSIDGGQTMEQKYIGMGVSKLQEMLTLPEEDLERVTKETTVKEIRAMKAAKNPPLSFFGWPAKVYPEGSLIATKGCAPADGKGGHDCFGCYRRGCKIRQEEQHCYIAPLGNPYPCSFTEANMETVRKSSINRDRCLHLHPELAPTRAGDGEPTPCCLLCEAYKEGACSVVCCDVAKREREKKRKEFEREQARQAAERKKAEQEKKKAEEAARRFITQSEWRVAYDKLGLSGWNEITAAELKEKFGRNHTGKYGYKYDIDCSLRGIRVNGCREETWGVAAKIFREIQKEEQLKHPKQEAGPEIIDADFREIDEAQPDPEPMIGARAAFEKARAKLEAEKAAAVPEVVDPDPEPEKPWKNYKAWDVKKILDKYLFDLEQYEKLQAEATTEKEMLPEWTLTKQQIITDALLNLYNDMERLEAEDDDEEED